MKIRLTTAARAAAALTAAAKRADRNKDGQLTTAEIHAAKSKNGAAATDALLDYHAQHRAMVLKDPEIAGEWKSHEMRHMDVDSVAYSVKAGLEQLGRIDAYKGNKAKGTPANSKDGVVTDAEIQNYGRTGGKLQLEARPLAEFAWTFKD